jgi:hypothetical protein
VGDAKDGHAGAAEILQGFDGVVDGDLREEAGACIENVNLFHFKKNSYRLNSERY